MSFDGDRDLSAALGMTLLFYPGPVDDYAFRCASCSVEPVRSP